MHNEITLTVAQLRGLYLLTPKADVRYYLNGVYIDFQLGRVIVTDGHKLIGLNVGNAVGNGSVIIGRDDVAAISKGGKTTDCVTISFDLDNPDRATLERVGGITLTCKPIDGRYPDYLRVLPAKLSGVVGQYNPHYMTDCAKALGLVTGANSDAYAVIRHNGDGPCVMWIQGFEDTAIVVIMPFRATEKGKVLNADPVSGWLANTVKPVTAKNSAAA